MALEGIALGIAIINNSSVISGENQIAIICHNIYIYRFKMMIEARSAAAQDKGIGFMPQQGHVALEPMPPCLGSGLFGNSCGN